MRASWPEGGGVELPGEGTVKHGRRPAVSTRVTFACPGGEAAFKRGLSAEEQARLRHVFERPEALLHVRGQHVGEEHAGEHEEPTMRVNASGRALTVSYNTVGPKSAVRLPTHAFASRKWRD